MLDGITTYTNMTSFVDELIFYFQENVADSLKNNVKLFFENYTNVGKI
jgi:hypothetical protein